MKVKILAFGITKDIVKNNSIFIDLNEGATVADLKNKLESEFPKFKALKSLLIAVNEEYGNDDLLISSSDEIALIPPVAGG